MLKRFSKYICQSVAAMIGQSVYILADTFFISFNSGANGLAALNLILPVFGIMFAIGSMIGIGSATRYGISKAKGEDADHYFTQSISWSLVWSRCRADRAWQNLSADRSHLCTIFYV